MTPYFAFRKLYWLTLMPGMGRRDPLPARFQVREASTTSAASASSTITAPRKGTVLLRRPGS